MTSVHVLCLWFIDHSNADIVLWKLLDKCYGYQTPFFSPPNSYKPVEFKTNGPSKRARISIIMLKYQNNYKEHTELQYFL